jgi:toxin ParE1/3/4
MSYILRPRAKADIISIAKYIADRNPAASAKWHREILDACAMIGDLPEIGQPRDDVRAELRTFPKGNYLIVFEPGGSEARILRVIHGARDWPKLVR